MKWLRRVLIRLCSFLPCLCMVSSLPAVCHAAQVDARTYERSLAVRSQSADPGDSALSLARERKIVKKENTILIYMIGSNLESRLGNATKDMLEMEQAGLDYEKSNLLVYAGGSRRWVGNVLSSCNGVYDLSLESQDRMIARTAANADMGSPDTLAEFLNFACTYYPAEHVSLIFWDHGGGPLWGYGSDELYDNDALLLTEMRQALEMTPFASDQKLDFVGFDACLMGCLECMRVWAPYASYYVASEELEPGDGWDYSFLRVYNETSDPRVVTMRIAECFGTYYEDQRTAYFNPDITLSCADLTKLDAVSAAWSRLCTHMQRRAGSGGYVQLQRVRHLAKSLGSAQETRNEETFSYDLVDLASFLGELPDEYADQADELFDALSELVFYQCTNVEGLGGVSLYYPAYNQGQYAQMHKVLDEISVSDSFTGYLDALSQTWLRTSLRNWTLERPVLSDDEWTLSLTPEQLAQMSAVTYTVTMGTNNGAARVLSQVPVTPDENGVLHIPADPTLILIETEDQALVCPVTVLSEESGRTVYRSDNLLFFDDPTYFYYEDDRSSCGAYAVLEQHEGGNALQIREFRAESETIFSSGKDTLDISQWSNVGVVLSAVNELHDAAGDVLPVSLWRHADNYLSHAVLEGNIRFIPRPAGKITGTFSMQVVLEDVNGAQYASPLTELSLSHTYAAEQEYTEQGVLLYRVYEDHAELTGYLGTDTAVSLPETVQDRPLTVIGSSVFCRISTSDLTNNPYPLRQITLPDSIEEIQECAFMNAVFLEKVEGGRNLRSIGASAFAGCGMLPEIPLPEGLKHIGTAAFFGCHSLKKVNLPGSLTHLGDGAFAQCYDLEQILTEEENACCVSVDGVLYSKDRTRLLAFPSSLLWEETFRVPEGVQEIASGALSFAFALTEVIFPASLKKIDAYACYGNTWLRSIVLPEGLLEIGAQAYGAPDGLSREETLSDWLSGSEVELYIGPSVSSVGAGAFDGIFNKHFVVDEDNPYFASLEGSLTNKARDAVVSLATRIGWTAVIPEGITSFSWDILDWQKNYNPEEHKYGTCRELYFPSSLLYFPEEAPDADLRNPYLIHCMHGSEAERFARRMEIDFDTTIREPFHRSVVFSLDGMYTYRVYEDHAMWEWYVGGEKVICPQRSVEGLPVTVAGSGETPVLVMDPDEISKVTSIRIPGGVQQVSDYAFGSSPLHRLNDLELPDSLRIVGDRALYIPLYHGQDLLPDHLVYLGEIAFGLFYTGSFMVTPELEYISDKVFHDCAWFTGFVMSETSEHYQVKDGALLNGDGTVLMALPPIEEGIYNIPDGVTNLPAQVFYSSDVEHVVFPQSMRCVEDHAFYFCKSLQSVTFNDGLEEIGPWAFQGCDALAMPALPGHLRYIGQGAFWNIGMEEPITLPDSLEEIGFNAFYRTETERISPYVLHIGSNLQYMGSDPWQNAAVCGYEVDPDNPFYKSEGGLLLDKGGTVLIDIAPMAQGEVIIPESVMIIGKGSLDHCPYVTDLYLHDGVKTFELLCGLNALSARIHCPAGSRAALYCKQNGISCVEDM